MSLTTIGTTVDEVLALVDELDEITHAGLDLRTIALRCGALSTRQVRSFEALDVAADAVRCVAGATRW